MLSFSGCCSISPGADIGIEEAIERTREQGTDLFFLVKEKCNQDILYSERCAIFWNETLVCLEI